jgi:hypothetical protein
MQTSVFLARLIGPVLLIAGIGLLANRRAFNAMAQDVLRSHALVYLFGLIDLAIGLAIVLTHNVWVADWRVLITLMGWLSIVRGTVRIVFPDQVMKLGARLLRRDAAMTASLAVAIVLGLVLIYFGYVA